MLSIDGIFASETKPKTGRDQAKTIAFPLAKNSLDQIRIGIKESQDFALIRAYLSAPSEAVGYGETDESTLTEVMERCRVAPDFYEAWLRDARAWKAAQAVTLPRPNVTHSPPPKVTQCTTCKHLKKPGRSSGYCGGGREDLPKAYGANHPLRKLPQNGGANCEKWAWDEW